MINPYEHAKDIYRSAGVDADAALEALNGIKISMHCWQGDDVTGFENKGPLSGGIAVTGSHPGKARDFGELTADIDLALSLIPGRHKINLHAIYLTTDEKVGRDGIRPEHFRKWVDFAKERGLGLDFNPTLFSHPKAADGLTLSHPDEKIRRFWIDHCIATRRIAEYFGRELGQPALNNIWIPDGYKDVPADRLSPRLRLKESLDEIFEAKADKNFVYDSVESKLFGIGAESYTVGSHEFYMNYVHAANNNIMCLLDSGHFHPTETIADKIPSMLLFSDKIALHVTRGVRWDSDHAVAFDDDLREIAKEIVRCGALDKVLIGLDYFDGSINRVAAWVIGMRNMQKALLYAMLLPHGRMAEMQDTGDFTGCLALTEEFKTYPFPAVWDRFCETNGVPVRDGWLGTVTEYEENVLLKRG